MLSTGYPRCDAYKIDVENNEVIMVEVENFNFIHDSYQILKRYSNLWFNFDAIDSQIKLRLFIIKKSISCTEIDLCKRFYDELARRYDDALKLVPA